MNNSVQKIETEVRDVKQRIEKMIDGDDIIMTEDEELHNLRKFNGLLGDVCSSLDAIRSNINKMDGSLIATHKLIDTWSYMLTKSNEISTLLFSEESPNGSRWEGSTKSMDNYKQKIMEYNRLLEKYQSLKKEKDAKIQNMKAMELKKKEQIRKRNEVLQKRVYGKNWRSRTNLKFAK